MPDRRIDPPSVLDQVDLPEHLVQAVTGGDGAVALGRSGDTHDGTGDRTVHGVGWQNCTTL